MNKARLEAFSDGVFSIIITIMVLDIKVPTTGHWQELLQPDFLGTLISYLTSFLLITSFWISHHFLISPIKDISRGFMWINNLALFIISLVPISTAWHGEFPNDSAPSFVYSAIYALTLFMLYILGRNTSKVDSNGETEQGRFGKKMNQTRLRVFLIGVLGAILSIWVPVLSSLTIIGISIFWIINSYSQQKKRLD